MVGEGEAGETGWAPLTVLKSRPRSLATLAEVPEESSAPLRLTAGSCYLEFRAKGWWGEHLLYSFETQYQFFNVLESFRADTVSSCGQGDFSWSASYFHLIHFLEC